MACVCVIFVSSGVFGKILTHTYLCIPLKAYVLHEQGKLLELVDPRLDSCYSQDEAMRMLNLALLCTSLSPTLRPSMSSVVSMLEGKTPIQAAISGNKNQDARFKAFEMLSYDSQTTMTSQGSMEQSGKSMDGPWVDSSISLPSNNYFSSSSKVLED